MAIEERLNELRKNVIVGIVAGASSADALVLTGELGVGKGELGAGRARIGAGGKLKHPKFTSA